jgi:hypothetical protein
VRLAFEMALASPKVRADAVEIQEFPDLAIRYQVMGVPRTVVNETVYLDGAMPEGMFVERALGGAGEAGSP